MVGQRIRYYRKVKGLTLEELSQGICSVSYLSKIEKAGAKSSDEVIIQLCERLGISPEEADNKEILDMLNEWNMMMVDRKFDQAKQFLKNVEEKMEGITNPELLLRFDLFYLRYLLSEEDLESCKNVIKKIEMLKDILTDELKFYYFLILGQYNYYIEDFKASLDLYLKAEELLKSLQLPNVEVAVLYYYIALTYSRLTYIMDVLNYTYKALDIFDKEYNYSRSADCHVLLGIGNRRIHNYSQAEYHYKQALKVAESFKDEFLCGVIYHNLGYIFSCLNDSKKAIENYKTSLVYKENQPNKTKYRTYYLIANELWKIGDKKQALEWLSKIKNDIKNADSELYYLYKVLEYQINDTKGIKFENLLSKKSIPYFEKMNFWQYMAEHSEILANYYYEISQYKKASYYYRLANEVRKKLI
ncbi:helix-turn-helix transcriptional regulator [Fictibacillus gelatini]|uniref:helix-turn-helix transcriptional regulator n=1 Tax=Fictibacillus gelatini TaxID=225985 RepID=UPI0004248A43|nr:helix-turn-helix transcriptional regulator [Fictibacillus gelatini]